MNIGLDSLVFVDDNPAERDLIRKEFGTLISVPELGDDVAKYRSILDGADLFTLTTLSREDKKKECHESNQKRENFCLLLKIMMNI